MERVYRIEGPKAWIECYTALLEYCVPKLQRTELKIPLQTNTEDIANLTPEAAYQLIMQSPDMPPEQVERLMEAASRPALPPPKGEVIDVEPSRPNGSDK